MPKQITIMELDWIRMDGKKGTLILSNEGIYFQPYDLTKKDPYLFGDAVSIGQTGVFGAINMYNELSKNPVQSITDIARKIRKENGLDQLAQNNMVVYINWNQIKNIKKKRLLGAVVVLTKKGNKIVVSDPNIRNNVFDFISKKITTIG